MIIGNPIYSRYLKWAYKKGVEDLAKLNFEPNFSTSNFRCLLCGVGNEKTANQFINFITERNKNVEIFIIDIGAEQLAAVRQLVNYKYPNLNITTKNIDALELTSFFGKDSLDWIETDGFLPFFDNQGLTKLLKVWHTILKPGGFITLRDIGTPGKWANKIFGTILIWIARHWLGVQIYMHTRTELLDKFKEGRFRVVEGPVWIPMMKRYSLIK